MRVTLLGVPGAGKGTQAGILSKKLDLPIISTGNLLRAAIESGTDLGMCVKDQIARGELVLDQIALDLVETRLSLEDCKEGCILDGVPRTLFQAKGLEEMDLHIDYCLLFDVADEIIIDRLAGRRTCPACGGTFHLTANPPRREGLCDHCETPLYIREDDTEETIIRRLNIFRNWTAPLIDYYKGQGALRIIPSAGTVEETTNYVLEAIKS